MPWPQSGRVCRRLLVLLASPPGRPAYKGPVSMLAVAERHSVLRISKLCVSNGVEMRDERSGVACGDLLWVMS